MPTGGPSDCFMEGGGHQKHQAHDYRKLEILALPPSPGMQKPELNHLDNDLINHTCASRPRLKTPTQG